MQFGFIEESLQIPFLAVCGLVWTFIISLFAGNAKKTYSKNVDNENIDSKTSVINFEDVKEIEKIIVLNSKKETSIEIEEKELVLR